MTVSTQASALLRNQLEFSGSVPARDSGASVEIQRLGRQTNWTWQPTAQASVNSDGTFTAAWRTNHIGRFAIRVVMASAGARAAAASPALSITVYRPSIATWYGPGFFGRRTACGQRLRRTTLGVANRRLPCGTEVALYYRGRTITVPVVDRGPFANNAEWDLTDATRQALGVTGTATIGAVSLPARPR
jgi:rare lipoprotein A (peptidoglycan hydrolase)